MKTSKTVLALLGAAALAASPASANYFSNPSSNTNLNVGSAPNPTPQQLRAIGDSQYSSGPARADRYERRGEAAPVDSQTFAMHPMTRAQLSALEGKAVTGVNGANLGYILAVNNGARIAEIQTPTGVGVAVSTMLLTDKGNHVIAPTMSKGDILAMAKSQTGRTIATNVDLRHGLYRG